MVDYERLYKLLFNGVTDALRCMEQRNFGFAQYNLTELQQNAENMFIEMNDT